MTSHSPNSIQSDTMIGVFLERIKMDPDGPGLVFFAAGRWQTLSWQAMADRVVRFSGQLINQGIQPGEFVVQVSENRYEWMLLDLAIQAVGAVHVPINPDLTRRQVQQQLAHCKPHLIVVSNQTQLEKVTGMTPDPCQVLTYDTTQPGIEKVGLFDPQTDHPCTLQQLSAFVSKHVDQDSLLTVLYTSGTTGEPKGVMLSQENVVSNARAKLQAIPLDTADVRLCWLPMSHVFSRVADQYTAYLAGCTSVISRGTKNLFSELTHFSPTYLNGVPYFYEKCFRTLASQNLLDEPGALQKLLGGRIRLCNCGGAPLANHVFDYFQAAGVELVTGYGLTEAAPVVSTNRPAANRRGSVGQAIDGVSIRIAEDGEILVRGPNVMKGYFRDKAATERVICQGWLHTGDLGQLDPDGYVSIMGRTNEMIITTGGHNVSPLAIETLLLTDPWIDQCVVVGDRRDYLTALIVPVSWPLDRDELGCRIHQRLSHLSRYEQIGRFRLIRDRLTTEQGLMTAKGSLRRKPILDKYAAEIEQLYTEIS